jgi:hypothetical protein
VSRVRLRENLDAYVFIGPWLIGFVLLTAGPMLGSIGLALSDWDLLNAPRLVGLKNFPEMVKDDVFWLSLYNTAYYTFLGVPIHLLLALLAAIALNTRLRFVNFYRTMVYLPSITPSVASAFLWMWIFNPDFGLANGALAALGAPTAALMVHASAPLLVSLGVSLSPLLHRNEASAALVTFTPLAELASPTRLSLGWRLVDRSNKAVTEGSVSVGLASPGKTVTYLVPFAAPSIRGPFTLELFATTENRVASVIVRKSVEIEAPRTYPGEPGAGAATRAGATPRP